MNYGPESGFNLETDNFFYDPHLDVMVKTPSHEEYGHDQRWCTDSGHFLRKLMVEDGRILCPACDIIELESLMLSRALGRRHSLDVDRIIDRLGLDG